MKKVGMILVLMAFCVVLSGCVCGNRRSGGKSHKNSNGCLGCVEGDSVIAEINMIKRLTLESSRRDLYMEIAKRDNLTPEVRGHLADEATKHLTLESSRRDVLMALAKNPSGQLMLCPEPMPEIETEITIEE